MVRVGSLVDLMSLNNKDTIDNKTGWSPKEQLEAIFNSIPPLMEKRDELSEQCQWSLEKRAYTTFLLTAFKGRRKGHK